MNPAPRQRRWTSGLGRAVGRALLLAVVLPLTAFVAVGALAPEFHLDRYEFVAGEGYVPAVPPAGEAAEPGIGELTAFYLRFAGGLLVGLPGRSRDAADRPLTQLLADRCLPSLGILAVALSLTAGAAALGILLGRSSPRRRRWSRPPRALLGCIVEGAPLPFVAMIAFVIVVRLAPRGSFWESDGAMVLWAGLALALGDAVLSGVLRDTRDETRRVARRPFVLAARLRGEGLLATLLPNLVPVVGARFRGAALLFLGGLVVVEPALGINGLGETFTDIVTDRAGTDALLFAGVLTLFAVPVALADLLATAARAGGTEGTP
jgi:ABC-type dipeptide/oligopeptide/nickel transport system permease component